MVAGDRTGSGMHEMGGILQMWAFPTVPMTREVPMVYGCSITAICSKCAEKM